MRADRWSRRGVLVLAAIAASLNPLVRDRLVTTCRSRGGDNAIVAELAERPRGQIPGWPDLRDAEVQMAAAPAQC